MVAQIPFLSQSNPSGTTSVMGIPETPADVDEPPDESEILSEEQPVPSQPPRTEEEEYRIQAGDTLGAIAVKYGITVDEIMRANDLTNPDLLDVGLVLIIPVPVEAQPTRQPPPAEATPTLAATDVESSQGSPGETPSPVSGPARVIIDSVVGAGDLESERVLLKRSGPGELSMAGWQLAEKGGKSFIFPQLTLFEGGAVNVYTRAGQATVVSLYWGLEDPVWESGEEVILLDNQGNEHASFTLP